MLGDEKLAAMSLPFTGTELALMNESLKSSFSGNAFHGAQLVQALFTVHGFITMLLHAAQAGDFVMLTPLSTSDAFTMDHG